MAITRTEAIDQLSKTLTPGQTIYTKVLHVSRSGRSRVIQTCIVENGEIRDISRMTAAAIGASFDYDRRGVKVQGVGMDMTFHVVYSLGCALYPQTVPCTGSSGVTPTGRKTKAPRCRSNEHFNDPSMPYSKRRKHRNGGYAFQNSSL